MALPHNRVPNLQVRDARAVSDRSELEALKIFFNSTLPPDEPPTRTPHGSIGKSSSNKKAGMRKTLFSMRKKRSSSDWNELGSYEESSRPALIPHGTTSRRLGDHTVIMIGSKAPPKPILSDLSRSPFMKSASSPVPSYRSPPQVLMSPQQASSSPVLATQSSSMLLSPPPRGLAQSLAVRDHVVRPPVVKSSSTIQAHTHTPRPRLPSSMTHTGVISRYSGQDRPDVASVETEDFVTAHNSPVMEPPPIYMHSPFVSRHSVATSTTSSMIRDRREISHFSVDSDDATSKPSTPVKIMRDACTQTEDTHIWLDRPEDKGHTGDEVEPPHRTHQLAKGTAAVQPILAVNSASTSSLSNSLQSSGSKKRIKKKRSIPMLHPSPVPNLEFHNDYMEILDLEEMEDKAMAFTQLAGMYKQQKFLRDAEHDLHRQRISDLTAGLVAQKMVNLKLLDALKERGANLQEISIWVGPTLDITHLGPDPSTDTLVSEDTPVLDPSRFMMLGKEAQLGKMREFSSSQGNLLSPMMHATLTRTPTENTLDLNGSASGLLLAEDVQRPLHTPISPVPSIPLPPLPSSRRAAKSMLLPASRPVIPPIARSRSLTEVSFPMVPYLDALNIDEKMRRLELEFAVSRSLASSTTTISVLASPKIPDEIASFEQAKTGSNRNNGDAGIDTPFELIVEEVMDIELEQEGGPLTSQASSDDGYQTGLHISSLGSSWATGQSSSDSFSQSISTSNDGHDGDESFQDPFVADSIDVSHAENELDSSSVSLEPPRDQRVPPRRRGDITPHTFYSESGFTPRPAGLSMDDSTWANLLMGLMRRTDAKSHASSEIDLEKGLTDDLSGQEQSTQT